MPDVLSVPVANGTGALAWSGRQSTITTILFYNTDTVNTVWLGSQSNITPAGSGTIPILPNGTFSGDPTVNWYVTGSTAGIVPLVVVPNGQGYFLGITAGMGNLVIPSVQSPNYVAGSTGWQIRKDGSVEFNNGTFRGFIVGGSLYIYNGAPSLGNPPIAWISSSNTDPFGNTVTPASNVVIGAGKDGSPQAVLQLSGTSGEISFPLPGTWVNYPNMFGQVSGSGGLLSINGPTDSTHSDQAFFGLESAGAATGFNNASTGFATYIDANAGRNTIFFYDYTGMTIYVAQSITAVKPGTGTSVTNAAVPEAWNTMTLANGWANVAGFAAAKYRKVASPPNSVEIECSINAAAATASTFFNLPAGYRPANAQPVCSMGANAAIPAGLSPWIKCDALGNLSVQNTGALGAWESFFHGFVALDA